MKRINVLSFLKKNQVTFKSETESLSFVKIRLKPQTLVPIGSSYFADESEMTELLNKEFNRRVGKKIKLKPRRVEQANKNFAKYRKNLKKSEDFADSTEKFKI